MAYARRRFTQWLLIGGNRQTVAALFVVAVFLSLMVLGSVGVIDVDDFAVVRGIAGGFIPGLIAFLSIVLAINQLVLSQEFGTAGEVQERIEGVREYRHDVEDVAHEGPSPVLPTEFLSFVVRTIEVEAAELEASVTPETDPEIRAAVERYAKAVVEEATRAHESLEGEQSGRINALLPVLEYNDSRQLFEARRLQTQFGDLPAETEQSLSRLIETIELFNVARTQFRTTYTQRVLARLSRHLLYVGAPALVTVVILGLMRAGNPLTFSSTATLVTVSALLSVALAPLAVLSAYLLRVATVSERTIAVGPFVSRPKTLRTGPDGGVRGRPTGQVESSAHAAGEDENR